VGEPTKLECLISLEDSKENCNISLGSQPDLKIQMLFSGGRESYGGASCLSSSYTRDTLSAKFLEGAHIIICCTNSKLESAEILTSIKVKVPLNIIELQKQM
jgi:hypothetical protein